MCNGAKKGSAEIIDLEQRYAAHNYHPIPVVLSRGSGAKVWDTEGVEYLDFLSAYSSVNQGHCHPRLVAAAQNQLSKLTLTSRAFFNDKLGPYAKFITEFFGYDMVLPMNTGAEGVETAIKLTRKWGYLKVMLLLVTIQKNIPQNKAIILACEGNFHGRTMTAVSISSDPVCKDHFGPFLPNVGPVVEQIGPIRYNNLQDLETALKSHGHLIAGFLVEPIQGEGGIVVPDDGYLKSCYDLCRKYNVLFIADEIQTGLCRTGKMLGCDYEGFKPDILILGKALSGGMYPISAVLANKDIMLCIQPGEHGSTYGGNPLASAIAIEALKILQDEDLAKKSFELGNHFRSVIEGRKHPLVLAVRGKGLMNGVIIDESKLPENIVTWHLCLLFKKSGLIAKQTQNNIIRFAPPLVISHAELDRGIEIILKSLDQIMHCTLSDFKGE
ncbi:ornithine aminotransferase [Mitosporidium daphniae]